MNIAYCITAYNNFHHLAKLINRVMSSEFCNVFVYVHVDVKSVIPLDFLNEFSCNERVAIIQRYKVWWGGWSHQQAILDLLIEANNFKSFDSYVILSGQDYQVCTDEVLHNTLAQKKEYINILEGFDETKPEWRLNKVHFEGFDRRNNRSLKTIFYKVLEKSIYLFYKKNKYPFVKVYHGSTWCALSGDCVNYIINFISDNPLYVNFYKTTWCAEESFIPTIIGNSKFINNVMPGFIYTDWGGKNPPIVLEQRHLSAFFNSDEFYNGTYKCKYKALFARKFNDTTVSLVDEIDSTFKK